MIATLIKRIKLAAFLLLAVMSSIAVLGQNTETTKLAAKYEKVSSAGLNASSFGGIGFSYRKWLGKTGYEISALPIIRQNTSKFIWSGISVMNKVGAYEYFDVYFSLGTNFIYSERIVETQYPVYYNSNSYYYTSYNTVYTKQIDRILNAGLLLGLESKTTSTLGYKFAIGYGAYDLLRKVSVIPGGEFGLYYRF